MTTRLDIRNKIREVITSTVSFPDATLNIWIADAILDYSNYIPYTTSITITCTATRYYSVTRMQGVISCEFPVGQLPTHYLQRKSFQSPDFYGGEYYDITPVYGLVLGQLPAAGQQIFLYYNTLHTIPTADGDVLTVADRHLDAIVLFVAWKAVQELEMNEMNEPDTYNNPFVTLVENMRPSSASAEAAYRNAIKDFLAVLSTPTETVTGPWEMDHPTGGRGDRIY